MSINLPQVYYIPAPLFIGRDAELMRHPEALATLIELCELNQLVGHPSILKSETNADSINSIVRDEINEKQSAFPFLMPR